MAGGKQVRWVQCNACNKWRTLPVDGVEEADLPDKWFCRMNEWDVLYARGCVGALF